MSESEGDDGAIVAVFRAVAGIKIAGKMPARRMRSWFLHSVFVVLVGQPVFGRMTERKQNRKRPIRLPKDPTGAGWAFTALSEFEGR